MISADAVQQNDRTTVHQLDTLIGNLHRGMKMRWNTDGTLIVRSANTAGKAYTVAERTCDCPAFHLCNHLRLHELLLHMAQTEADSADIAALADDVPGDDCGDHGPHADDDCPKCASPLNAMERRGWPLRIGAARSVVAARYAVAA